MYTISRDYRKEIVIEKSRFICSLKKVHSEAEAQEFIKAVKKEFWDATHNCSAYIVDDLAQRSSDDGEPSGTAGIPMLEVLRKNGLTETAEPEDSGFTVTKTILLINSRSIISPR